MAYEVRPPPKPGMRWSIYRLHDGHAEFIQTRATFESAVKRAEWLADRDQRDALDEEEERAQMRAARRDNDGR